jgi:hypothetical protein
MHFISQFASRFRENSSRATHLFHDFFNPIDDDLQWYWEFRVMVYDKVQQIVEGD